MIGCQSMPKIDASLCGVGLEDSRRTVANLWLLDGKRYELLRRELHDMARLTLAGGFADAILVDDRAVYGLDQIL
jgi:hypothetical protein